MILTPANKISFLGSYKKALTRCCNDPLRPPRSSGLGQVSALLLQIGFRNYSKCRISTAPHDPYYPRLMLKQSERFQFLAHQFNSLVERYNEAPTPGLEQRTKLLRGMKVVIVEIDMLVLSALRRDSATA